MTWQKKWSMSAWEERLKSRLKIKTAEYQGEFLLLGRFFRDIKNLVPYITKSSTAVLLIIYKF